MVGSDRLHAAYREVGSYRGAAEICGTTHKTVKRQVLRAEREENAEPEPAAHNYDEVRDLVAAHEEQTMQNTKKKAAAWSLPAWSPARRPVLRQVWGK